MSGLILFYLLLKPLSWLPLRLLYAISSLVCFFLFYVFGYRKKVVWDNIAKAFPEKTEAERQDIMKAFYKHLSELLAEGIKAFSITRKELQKRFRAVNPELFEPFFDAGKNVLIVSGHYNNWEWYAISLGVHVKHTVYGVYKPIKNKHVDKRMRASRGRMGLRPIPMEETLGFVSRQFPSPVALILLNDQSPSNPGKAVWVNFLGRKTPVLPGTEIIAKRKNWPLIYGEITKIRRGYYQVEYKVLCENPSQTEGNEITRVHSKALEDTIRKAPEYYLWSHKKWKHSPKE